MAPRCLALLLAALCVAAPAANAAHNRFIVKFSSERGRAAALAAAAAVYLEFPDAVAVALPAGAAEALARSADVVYVEEDPRRYPTQSTTQRTPWGIPVVQADVVAQVDPEAYANVAAAGGKKICIIDSGFDASHEDLPKTGVTGSATGWNTDKCGHGTHVAGTMSALTNSLGVVGVAPAGVNLHIVKVFGDRCSWTYSSGLVAALDACLAAGADVVSMSLGGSGSSTYEHDAFANAAAANVLPVAAAGNGGNSAFFYPASYPSVVSVAAVDSAKNRASFSQYNVEVDLAAPGVSVLSTTPKATSRRTLCYFCSGGTGYESWSGTSMATPHVSAVAALVWSSAPACTAAQVRNALQATALDLLPPGRDDQFGWGLVQAKAALTALKNNCGQ